MNLDAIKEAIADLPAHERMALAMWLTEQQMDAWDKQMLQDFSAGGRGMHLVKKIRGDIRAGKFKPMDEVPDRSSSHYRSFPTEIQHQNRPQNSQRNTLARSAKATVLELGQDILQRNGLVMPKPLIRFGERAFSVCLLSWPVLYSNVPKQRRVTTSTNSIN